MGASGISQEGRFELIQQLKGEEPGLEGVSGGNELQVSGRLLESRQWDGDPDKEERKDEKLRGIPTAIKQGGTPQNERQAADGNAWLVGAISSHKEQTA